MTKATHGYYLQYLHFHIYINIGQHINFWILTVYLISRQGLRNLMVHCSSSHEPHFCSVLHFGGHYSALWSLQTLCVDCKFFTSVLMSLGLINRKCTDTIDTLSGLCPGARHELSSSMLHCPWYMGVLTHSRTCRHHLVWKYLRIFLSPTCLLKIFSIIIKHLN